MARLKKTLSVADVAGELLGKADPAGRRFGARVVAAWHEVCGEVVSTHTRGVAFTEGELIVSVDSPAWAQELGLMADDFRSALNTHLGQELVRGLRFTVSRRVQTAREDAARERDVAAYYAPDVPAPVPLTDVERQQVAYISRAVPDDRLREIAQRVMTKDLEWKKAQRARLAAEAASGDVSGPKSTV